MIRRVILALALVLPMTACAVSGPDPVARKVAEGVASAFTTGNDFKSASFDDPAAQAAYKTIVNGMLGMKHVVTVDGVSTNGDSGEASLRWSWPIGNSGWAYETKLKLARTNGNWVAKWRPDVVGVGLTGTAALSAKRTFQPRGKIIAGDGSVLVEPRPVVTVGISLANIPAAAQPASAAALAALVGMNPTTYTARVAAVAAQSTKAFVPALTYRADQVPPPVSAGIGTIAGATAVPTTLPMPPTKDFASTLLGSVGPVTAELVAKANGRLVASDIAGLSGLQQRYDERLAGTPAVTVSRTDNSGTHQIFQYAGVAGQDIHLSLAPSLQQLAQSVLPAGTTAASLVAIKPSTGQLLAVADNAGTNGNPFSLTGHFAPGSTFKSVTSLALLRAGLTPATQVPCTQEIVVDGQHIPNDSFYPPGGLGNISLTTALADSCNTAFLSQRGKLADGALADAAATLGFGKDAETGYPSYFGQIPAPKGTTEAASDMIGQGRVSASPLSMATVMSSIVAGHTVTPSLVSEQQPEARNPAHPLTDEEATALRSMLRAVVATPDGTGAALNGLPGGPIIAKTGTAEFDAGGGNIDTHAWMIAAQGDLALAVVVDQGKTGASVAGPIVAAFLKGSQG